MAESADQTQVAPSVMPNSWRETHDLLAACVIPAVLLMSETAPTKLAWLPLEDVVNASERVRKAMLSLESWCIRLMPSDTAPAWAKCRAPDLAADGLDWHRRAQVLEAALASLYQERVIALDFFIGAAQGDEEDEG